MSLRQPIELPVGFGPRSSMSFFLYNQDGTQAIARPYLDGGSVEATFGPAPTQSPPRMPKYHMLDSWDTGTNAPSQNFVYDFDRFRYCVNDSWREVLSHSADGEVASGSLDELVDAFSSGCAIKLGIGNLCADLGDDPNGTPDHEVFVQGGSAYYYTDQKLFMIGSHPLVRVRPSVPVRYASRNWDFGWLMVRRRASRLSPLRSVFAPALRPRFAARDSLVRALRRRPLCEQPFAPAADAHDLERCRMRLGARYLLFTAQPQAPA